MTLTRRILEKLDVNINDIDESTSQSLLRTFITKSVDNYAARSRFIHALALATIEAPKTKEMPNVPKYCFQFWDDSPPPKEITRLTMSWRENNSNFTYEIFDSRMAREMIAEQLGSEVVIAFDNCNHPVLQSDLFRFCVLYIRGGVYTDADEQCLAPIEDLIEGEYFLGVSLRASIFLPEGRKGIAVSDALRGGATARCGIYFNNSPLFAPAKSPLVAFMIEKLVFEIQKQTALGIKLRVQNISSPLLFNQRIMTWLLEDISLEDRLSRIRIFPDWYERRVTEPPLLYKKTDRHWSKM
jgi:hypothetical protein